MGFGKIEIKDIRFPLSFSHSLKCINSDKFMAGILSVQFQVPTFYEVRFKDVSCFKESNSFDGPILHSTKKMCLTGTRYEIGFPFGDHDLIKTIDLCHYEKRSHTFWAHYEVHPSVEKSKKTNTTDRKYKKGNLYQDIDFSYNATNVYNSFLSIFDLNKTKADKYISSEDGKSCFYHTY